MAFINYAGETEEERKKRLEQEAAAAAMADEAVASGGAAPVAPSAFGQYLDNRLNAAQNRFDQAAQYFTDPEAALQRRLGMQQEAANTEVETQTVKTYGDGSQERIVKTQMPAPVTGPAVPEAQPQPMATPMAAPAPTAPVAAVAPGAEQRPQVHPVFAQAVQQNQAQPAQPVAPIPPEAAQQPVVMPALPTPGPGVQVASTDAAAGLQAAAAARAQQQQQQVAAQAPAPTPSLQQQATQPAVVPQPVPTEAPWVKAANEAGNDFLKLAEVAGKYPESRQAIIDKLQTTFKNKSLEDQANKLIAAAQAGDLKAMNQLEQAIKPDRGRAKEEVGVSDYLKLYMYHRLGLGNTEMARQLDAKISGTDTKYGQITVGGTNWSVETDNKTGQIIRAKDDEGNVATKNTLNKIAAAGQKFGGQIYSSTGGAITIPAGQPDAGEEYRQVFNSTTGKFENQITTGPNAGKTYSGPAGLERRVATNAAVALNDAYIKFQTAPTTAMATEILKAAAMIDDGTNGALDKARATIQQRSPQIYNEVKNTLPSVPGQPNIAAGAPRGPVDPAELRRSQSDVESLQKEINRTKPGETNRLAVLNDELARAQQRVRAAGGGVTPAAAGGGGGSLVQQKAQQEANIQAAKEVAVAEAKPAAEAKGKITAKDINNQNFADETYGLIRPVAELVKKSTGSGIGAKVDSIAALLGSSTQGAQAIAELEPMVYPILANIPRFEGAQSEYDVKTYQRAAGDFANPEKPIKTRLAALQGMISLLKKYDKEGKNDWTFGGTTPAEGAATGGTTASGNKFKRVQ